MGIQLCIDICERHKSNSYVSLKKFKDQLQNLDEPDGIKLYESFKCTKEKLDSILCEFSQQVKEQVLIPSSDPKIQKIESKQNQHLKMLSNDLRELEALGKTMSDAFTQQGELLDSLSAKNDENMEKTKMVNRRADRMIRKRQFITGNPVLH